MIRPSTDLNNAKNSFANKPYKRFRNDAKPDRKVSLTIFQWSPLSFATNEKSRRHFFRTNKSHCHLTITALPFSRRFLGHIALIGKKQTASHGHTLTGRSRHNFPIHLSHELFNLAPWAALLTFPSRARFATSSISVDLLFARAFRDSTYIVRPVSSNSVMRARTVLISFAGPAMHFTSSASCPPITNNALCFLVSDKTSLYSFSKVDIDFLSLFFCV